MWPCGSSGAPHSGHGGRPAADDPRGAGRRRAGRVGGHPDAQQVRAVLVLVVVLVGVDRLAVLGLGARLDQDPLGVAVPAEGQRAGPERLVERLVERAGVLAGGRRGSRGGRRTPRRSSSTRSSPRRSARTATWTFSSTIADDARAVAGLQEERAIARLGRRCRPRSARADRRDSDVATCPDSIPKRASRPASGRRQPTSTPIVCQPRAPSGAGGERLLRLDDAGAVGGPDLDRVPAGRRRPVGDPLDPRRVRDRRRQPGLAPDAVDRDLDPRDAAVRRPGDARDRDRRPAATPPRGVSIRDWVRIGASLAQPSGHPVAVERLERRQLELGRATSSPTRSRTGRGR